MTVAKHGPEAWALLKVDEDLLDVFQANCPWIVLGIRMTDRTLSRILCEGVIQSRFLGL